MMKRNLIILLLLVAATVSLTGCGMSLSSKIIDVPDIVSADETDEFVNYWIDDHRATRKSADRAFDAYARKAFQGEIRWRALMSIKPEKTKLTMTYDFAYKDGVLQRLTLTTKNFSRGYRKKHKQTDKAYVNGKQYEFRH